jgi:hypothetical protein
MSTCSSLTLNCFNWDKYTLFILGACIIPYLLYRSLAEKLHLVRRNKRKTSTQHVCTIIQSIVYMTILWHFGNYEETFNNTTFTWIIIGLVTFTFVAEICGDTHEHTLATMHKWNNQMISLVSIATVIIAVFGKYHVQLASSQGSEFAHNYILGAIVPIFISYMMYNVAVSDKKIFHLHHVHLFYVLAFFTRFPNDISRIAAGLAIGCSLHGAAAYGYDTCYH